MTALNLLIRQKNGDQQIQGKKIMLRMIFTVTVQKQSLCQKYLLNALSC